MPLVLYYYSLCQPLSLLMGSFSAWNTFLWTTLKQDHPRNILVKFHPPWPSFLRQDAFWIKYWRHTDTQTNDRQRKITIALHVHFVLIKVKHDQKSTLTVHSFYLLGHFHVFIFFYDIGLPFLASYTSNQFLNTFSLVSCQENQITC